jgi:hypothetical protein
MRGLWENDEGRRSRIDSDHNVGAEGRKGVAYVCCYGMTKRRERMGKLSPR